MSASTLAADGPSVPPAATLLSDALSTSLAAPRDREHVVLMVDQFPAVLGGGERVVLRTARMLQDAGYRVSIVTFQILCAPAVLQQAECPVYLLPIESVFSLRALGSAWQLGRFLRRAGANYVITFFESSNLFGGIAVKALSRARLIWNRRDMGILREPKHTVAYRWLPFLPDYVIAVSEQVRRHAVDMDRIPAERVGVLYNAVDTLSAPEADVRPARPVVVTVGNIRPVKGHDTLVQAAAYVVQAYPDAQFQIAGDPLDKAYLQDLQEQVRSLGLLGSVHFLGGVTEPSKLLQTATVFVLPSRSEGFSNAIVEAMAAGLPVVATTVGGNAEAVQEGVTGLLVPPEQPTALAAALIDVLADPERARSMGEAGRERARRLFSRKAMLQGYRDAFARANSRGKRNDRA